MNWQTIRLELAGTREFPTGSTGRAFLLRLPLQDDGTINEEELARRPARATVRRYWASEPDRSGRIVRGRSGWDLDCGRQDAARLAFHLPPQQIRLGGKVVVTAPDGRELPFRVASMTTLG